MALLAEAISVVIRRPAIDAHFPGGWQAFVEAAPNQTLCADDHLVRLGFIEPAEVEDFVNALGAHGIRYLVDDTAADLVVVDQRLGPMAPCEWIQFGRVTIGDGVGDHVAGCRLVGDDANILATPDGWVFEGSLSQQFGLAAPEPQST